MRPERIISMILRRFMRTGMKQASKKLNQGQPKSGSGAKMSPDLTKKMRRLGKPF